MAIWDIVDGFNVVGHKDWEWINSSYNSVIGDSVSNIMGGGRFTNILGTDAKLVVDLEGLLEHTIGHGLHSTPTTMGGILMGLVGFGVGGDTGLSVGNKNAFHYFGDAFNAKRGLTKLDVEYKPDDQFETRSIQNAPVLAMGIGLLALFAGAFALQLHPSYNLGSKDKANKVAQHTACLVLPILEARWLWLIKFLELLGATVLPLRKEKAALDAEEGVLKPFYEMKLRETEDRIGSIITEIHRETEKLTIYRRQITLFPELAAPLRPAIEAIIPLLRGLEDQLNHNLDKMARLLEQQSELANKQLNFQEKLEGKISYGFRFV